MHSYTVKITQTREGYAEIQAESEAQALRIALERYERRGEELPDMEDGLPLKFIVEPRILRPKLHYLPAAADFEYLQRNLSPEALCTIDDILAASADGKVALAFVRNEDDSIDFDAGMELKVVDPSYTPTELDYTVLKWWDSFEDTGYLCDVVASYMHKISHDEMSLTAKIQSAGARAAGQPKHQDRVCKVVFRRAERGDGPYQFDVSLDEIPKMYAHEKDVDVFLNADSRIEAYEKAAKVVGEAALSDYVIAYAEIVSTNNMEHNNGFTR